MDLRTAPLAAPRAAARNRRALLVALGVDNLGSGLFLPLAIVYVTRVVGLSLGQAGVAVTAGTVAGLLVPPLAGRLVDRVGPRPVVIGAQLLQAAGAGCYLAAHGVAVVVVAALLLAAGQQVFYSSLFALIADVAGDGPKDRPFAVAGMVRSACFGAGALVAGALLTTAGSGAYRIAVAADGASFLLCALLLALAVRVRAPHRAGRACAPARLLTDRPYLALIAICSLAALAGDFFLVGMPVYALAVLRCPVWLPGAILALVTAISSVAGTAALRATRRLTRIGSLRLGTALYGTWCALGVAALVVPPGWRPAYLLAITLVLGAAGSVFARVNALAEAAAPPAARGAYLAGFQYAFTVAGVLAPAVVALFAVAGWVPWLVIGAAIALSFAGLRWVGPRLPAAAVAPPR